MELLPQHLEDLRKSGLTDPTIKTGGFYSISDAEKIAVLLGWRRSAKDLGPCLAIPFPDQNGNTNGFVRLKPDYPLKDKEGRSIKYLSPKGKGNRAYFPPGILAANAYRKTVLTDPTCELIITEGEKKAAAAIQFGVPAIGLIGVWGWTKKRNDKAQKRKLIDDLAGIAWQGRKVIIAFDSDIAEKPEIQWAEFHLAEMLKAAGAIVLAIRLPSGEKKMGVDDYLIAQGPDGFKALLTEAKPIEKPQDGRAVVTLGTLEHVAIEQAISALAKSDQDIYKRGNVLVRLAVPKRAPAKSGITFSGAPTSEPIPPANLRARITEHANVVTATKNKKGETKISAAHPTPWLVNGVHAAGTYPGIHVLEGVVSAPVLLADGRILQTPGYDPNSGLLFVPHGDFAPVPENPSRDDALAALARLFDLVCDFPFECPEHQSAWLAALLTALARHAFDGPAPLFLVDANIRGAGKGLSLHVISTIVAAGDFAIAPYTTDDRE